MTYLTRKHLNQLYSEIGKTKAKELLNRPNTLNESQKIPSNRTIFLSHSHKDRDIVETVAVVLLKQSIEIYVDWKDSSMPDVTSAETAKEIKKRIKACDHFIVLVSNNALDSKWVPWELGFADEAKGESNIFILPIAEDNGNWGGAEYFDLYQKIELGSLTLAESLYDTPKELVVSPPEYQISGNSLMEKLKISLDKKKYYL